MAARAEIATAASGWRHFFYVTLALSKVEFKLRYFGSVLGYLWSFLRPFLLFGVLYVVFTKIVRAGTHVHHYPVMLLLGLVLFNFFSEATTTALPSLVQRENLLRKVAFPRAAVPIAVATTAAANLLLGLAVVLLLALVNGVDPMLSWLLLLPIFAGVLAFAAGLALLLSILFVRYRDAQPVWELVLQFVFWGTPIIYTIQFIPERYRQFVMYNPLAVAIEQARHWLIDPNIPSAATVLGSDAKLAIPLGIFVAVSLLGVWAFRRGASRVAEEL
ncbi:MAG: ABC transporter permease [Gaiellaceae bacterium]